MTRLDIRLLIENLINDNFTGEVTAQDMREALMLIYDQVVRNAPAGTGGVQLPLTFSDVSGLTTELAKIDANTIAIAAIKTASANNVNVCEVFDVNGTVRISMTLDDVNDLMVITLFDDAGVKASTMTMGEDGALLLPDAPTQATQAKEVVTLEMLQSSTASIITVTSPLNDYIPTAGEAVSAMNTGGFDFANDIEFKLIGDDGKHEAIIVYQANGDTDESGVNYRFRVKPLIDAGGTCGSVNNPTIPPPSPTPVTGVTEARVEEIIREFDVTVSMDTAGNKPDKAECIAAFKLLPHFDWAMTDRFYIMSVNKDKYNMVKYIPNGDTDETGTNYQFFIKELTLAA